MYGTTDRNLYAYQGAILQFDRVVADNWIGRTLAKSERQARTNLAYQYKQQCGLTPSARITLPGKVVRISH